MTLIVFASTRNFLASKALLEKEKIPHHIRTTPRDLYEHCGMCLEISPNHLEQTQQLLPPTLPYLLYLQDPMI